MTHAGNVLILGYSPVVKEVINIWRNFLHNYGKIINTLPNRSQCWLRLDTYVVSCWTNIESDDYRIIEDSFGYSSVGCWRTTSLLFVYDTQSRNSALISANSDNHVEWIAIPTIRGLYNITQHFAKSHRTVFIQNEITLNLLFKNTILEHLNQNTVQLNDNLLQFPMSIKLLSSQEGQTCIPILILSWSDHILELLSKSGKFNLYNFMLSILLKEPHNIWEDGIRLSPYCKLNNNNLDAKIIYDYPSCWNWLINTSIIEDHARYMALNLEKVFRLSNRELNWLNQYLGSISFRPTDIIEGYEHDEGIVRSRSKYTINSFKKELHINPSDLNEERFMKLATLFIHQVSPDLCGEVYRAFDNSVTALNVCYEYYDNLAILMDYYYFRRRLQKLQTQYPQYEIFSEKQYPKIPSKGKKFVTFAPGNRFSNWDDFVRHYSRWYDNHQFIPNQGVLLTLTSYQMMRYLHDEATFWTDFYQDVEQHTKFLEAINRAKAYEYEDTETKLCIIAPTSIEDMRREGTILEHCVSTYVSSVAEGITNILFIRRLDRITEPFATLELTYHFNQKGKIIPGAPKVIRQVQCWYNQSVDREGQKTAYDRSKLSVYDQYFDVTKFLHNWTKKYTDIDPQTIHNSYKARCAER